MFSFWILQIRGTWELIFIIIASAAIIHSSVGTTMLGIPVGLVWPVACIIPKATGVSIAPPLARAHVPIGGHRRWVVVAIRLMAPIVYRLRMGHAGPARGIVPATGWNPNFALQRVGTVIQDNSIIGFMAILVRRCAWVVARLVSQRASCLRGVPFSDNLLGSDWLLVVLRGALVLFGLRLQKLTGVVCWGPCWALSLVP